MKILVIEDDPRQIAWAKETLLETEHEFTFVSSYEEIGKEAELRAWQCRCVHEVEDTDVLDKMGTWGKIHCEYDYVLTDVFFPGKVGEEPTPKSFFDLFEDLIEILGVKVSLRGKESILKGIGVLSTFQTHFRENTDYVSGITEKFSLIEKFSRKINRGKTNSYEELLNELKKKNGIVPQLIVIFNTIGIGAFPAYLFGNRLVSNENGELKEQFPRSEEVVPLKPYRAVLEALLEGSEK